MTKEKAVQLINEYLTICREALIENERLKEEITALDIESDVLSRMLDEKCNECVYRKEKEDA